MATKKKLKVTLQRSVIAIHPNHKLCVRGLGLRRIRHSVEVADTACNRGMINKVAYLLSVEECK
jgi:large subunit ribosomal protein L30